ncbi:MAG: hypothetical protein ABEJ43_01170 [Haloferacaceae archaeon]
MTDAPDVDPPGTGWTTAESSSETVFDLGPVEVTAATVVFEDRDLRSRVAERTGLDRTWRFAFASRVDVPGSSGSRALARLVTDRARSGFADRLERRGFEAVERAGERSFGPVDAARYVARVRVEGVVVDAEGWLGVRADPDRARSFALAGGAYPRGVRDAPDEATREGLSGLFEPAAFRDELLGFLRR